MNMVKQERREVLKFIAIFSGFTALFGVMYALSKVLIGGTPQAEGSGSTGNQSSRFEYLNESYYETERYATTSDLNPQVPATLSQFIMHCYNLNRNAFTNSVNPQDMINVLNGAKERDPKYYQTVDALQNLSWKGRTINPMGIITNNDSESSGLFLYDKIDASAMLNSVELNPNVNLSKYVKQAMV